MLKDLIMCRMGMGDCYYVKTVKQKNKDQYIRVASEQLMDEGIRDEITKFTNTTCGIWFYESDVLYRKEELKNKLKQLVEDIDLFFELPYTKI